MKLRLPPDYHLHTIVTEDAIATLEEHARAAAAKGIPEIAVTDHFILGYDNYLVTIEQLEGHRRQALALERELGIKILIGIEADYIESRADEIAEFLGSFEFDLVIGAAHFVDGCGIASENGTAALIKKHGVAEAYRRSLRFLARATDSGLFDVMAHLDVIRKFAETPEKRLAFSEYEEEAAEVARAMLRTGAGFEVNCRGFSHDPASQYPSGEFLKMLKEFGVGTVTIGSDAHNARNTGDDLDRGLKVLSDAGFDSLTLFEDRNRRPAPIADFIPRH